MMWLVTVAATYPMILPLFNLLSPLDGGMAASITNPHRSPWSGHSHDLHRGADDHSPGPSMADAQRRRPKSKVVPDE